MIRSWFRHDVTAWRPVFYTLAFLLCAARVKPLLYDNFMTSLLSPTRFACCDMPNENLPDIRYLASNPHLVNDNNTEHASL